MAEDEQPEPQAQLEGGAYEVIRARLERGAGELRSRLSALNEARQAIFGASGTELVATERVTTANACVPRDMIAVGGDMFLFGYNVQLGLKSTTELSDVFSAYRYDREAHTFHEVPLGDLLGGGGFADDFAYLYKYYKETLFVKFMVRGAHLFMAFRVGKGVDDLKTFKFLRAGDGTLEYLGNRFDHEYVFPPQQEFEWTRAHRDMHRDGAFPHISIEDRVFVEAVGGDLTVKVEDNTESGQGIYSEPVENADQTLDDAETFYAAVGSLILLRIKPYQERDERILVFNEKTVSVRRIDSIRNSCVLLPDGHGIIFADGYHLQTGETKIFSNGLDQMVFERRIASANGEDFLYVFYNRRGGEYVLMPYNLIAQKVDQPIVCNGYSLFDSGELIYFRCEEQPNKHHALQAWRTPYTAEAAAAGGGEDDSYLAKIGNADIVRCMAECGEVLTLLGKDDTYADLYVDLAKKAGDICDAYFWVAREEAGNLREPLELIRGAAGSAIDEFDRVQRQRRAAADAAAEVGGRARKVLSAASHQRPDDILGFVHRLAELRSLRGEVIGLREMHYADLPAAEALEAEVAAATEKVSEACAAFLLQDEALDPYRRAVEEQKGRVEALGKVAEAEVIGEELAGAGGELEMLIEVVGGLKIEDATQATAIIDAISGIYAELNAVRASVKARRKELAKSEGAAQFGAGLKLLEQAVQSYLDLCETPEKCEEYLTKAMVSLEELEGRFGEFEDYAAELGEKREAIYDAFETRKQVLLEARGRRAAALFASADRIFAGMRRRLEGFGEINEIHGYFAGDVMVAKVRDVVAALSELGETVKADEVATRLKAAREDAVRALKDKQDLFDEGGAVIKLGRHRFNVNRQELELSVVPRGGQLCFHLGGTEFFERIDDERLSAAEAVWGQSVVSESEQVYRAEYLAWLFLNEGPAERAEGEGLAAEVAAIIAPRYAEGYTKGVHDRDAAAILEALLPMHAEAGLLRYPPADRVLGLLFWESWAEAPERELLGARLRSLGTAAALAPVPQALGRYAGQLAEKIGAFVEGRGEALAALRGADPATAAEYLAEELAGPGSPVASAEAAALSAKFRKALTSKRLTKRHAEATAALAGDAVSRFAAEAEWVSAALGSQAGRFLPEAAWLVLQGGKVTGAAEVQLVRELPPLAGTHPSLGGEGYRLDYLDFSSRLRRFCREAVPRFTEFSELKTRLAAEERAALRLGEFKPRVMGGFVRNRLLDEVYLPLVGDNLAKQMGVAGEDTRTDRMGLLLLVSPPGYGKTTLMEYIAQRLGVTFMKINGPALGHGVTSLDPAEAPDAGAREEVKKLNLALEMGDNVMIYLDDIQHCNAEFLQKFISLCDAQRKIEGVYNGRARTYDLRGKKVAVVMAGNPYTESGGKFRIPDMLANRADTYNLGDILGEHGSAFEESYVENALTSNAALAKLAARAAKDVRGVMRIAENGSAEGVEFEGSYTADELEEMTSVVKKLLRVRDTILRVNEEYIRSAAQEDAYRTEPAFKLQGSYRNMNRIAEKVQSLMTDEEVEALIDEHYEGEAQTLTSGAEANLLKFREMEGKLSAEEAERWAEIKRTFARRQLLGGGDEDPVTRVVGALGAFQKGLEDIRETIGAAGASYARPQTLGAQTVEQLEKIIAGLRSVPVDVQINVLPVEEAGEGEPPVAVKSGVKQG